MLRVNDFYWLRAAFKTDGVLDETLRSQRIENFGAASSFEAAMIVFLLGAGDVLNEEGGLVSRQRRNFGILGAPVARGSRKGFLKSMETVGLDCDLVNRYLRKSTAQQSYYRELLLELLHFSGRTSRGQHSLAFLHLYRLLERVSYVFPITYALKSDNFKGTYDSFKSFLTGDKSGELKFFQNFQSEVLDEALQEASLSFDFQSLPYGGEAAGYGLVKRFSSPDCFVSENPGVEISIKCRGVVELAVNLRNRFFHAGSGHPANISLVELADPDSFFGRVNLNFINWLSVVYFQTLAAKAERYS